MCPNKRNNKGKTPVNDKPPKTTDCSRCGEAIIIPNKCVHGMKRVNCRGTDCITAHLAAHDAHCPAPPRVSAAKKVNDKKDGPKPLTEQALKAERDVILDLIEKELENLEKVKACYDERSTIDGVPREKYMENLRRGPMEDAKEFAKHVRALAEEEKFMDLTGYYDNRGHWVDITGHFEKLLVKKHAKKNPKVSRALAEGTAKDVGIEEKPSHDDENDSSDTETEGCATPSEDDTDTEGCATPSEDD